MKLHQPAAPRSDAAIDARASVSWQPQTSGLAQGKENRPNLSTVTLDLLLLPSWTSIKSDERFLTQLCSFSYYFSRFRRIRRIVTQAFYSHGSDNGELDQH